MSNGEITTRNVVERDTGVGILESLPDSGIDAKNTDDFVVVCYDYVSKFAVTTQ